MSQAISRFLFATADTLDSVRATFLRASLSYRPLRPLFFNRAWRLAVLFAIAATAALFFALAAPLWVLLLGPLVYGVPHIFAGIRYFDFSVRTTRTRVNRARAPHPRVFAFVAGATFSVFAWRLVTTFNLLGFDEARVSEWQTSSSVEACAMLGLCLFGARAYRLGISQTALAVAALAPLILALQQAPQQTIALLVVAHNFIAFAFWIRAARTGHERVVAMTALATAMLVSAALVLGKFDALSAIFSPSGELAWGGVSFELTGLTIFPGSTDEVLWSRAASAFAFGQALHYFVWLKAVPDQFHYNEVPTSWKQSLGLLEGELGKKTALLLVVLSVMALGVWCLLRFERARSVYFCLAAYHGYVELAALALIFARACIQSRSGSVSGKIQLGRSR